MRRTPLSILLVSALATLPCAATAQEPPATEPAAQASAALQILPAEDATLEEYLWRNRVLVVFSDTPVDPRFVKQLQMIEERPRDLVERDVVVLTDSDPDAKSDVRQMLRPRGFALVLVDKDGGVKLRKPSPWSTREITRSIDKTPLRRQEIRDRSGASTQ